MEPIQNRKKIGTDLIIIVNIIPEEYFVKYYSSEGTHIGATKNNQTWGIFHHRD